MPMKHGSDSSLASSARRSYASSKRSSNSSLKKSSRTSVRDDTNSQIDERSDLSSQRSRNGTKDMNNLNSFLNKTSNNVSKDNKYFGRRSVATAPLPRLGNSNSSCYGNSSKSLNKTSSSRSTSSVKKTESLRNSSSSVAKSKSTTEYKMAEVDDVLSKGNESRGTATSKSNKSKKSSASKESRYEWHKLAVKAVSYIDTSISKKNKDIISVAIIKALSQNGGILRNNDEDTLVDANDILSDAAVIASNLVLKSTNGDKELAVIAAKSILQAGYYTKHTIDESTASKSATSIKSSKSKLSKSTSKSIKSSKEQVIKDDESSKVSEVFNDYCVLKVRDNAPNKINSFLSQSFNSIIDSAGDYSSAQASNCTSKDDLKDTTRPINKVLDNSSESVYHEKLQPKQPKKQLNNRVVDDNSVQTLFQRITPELSSSVPSISSNNKQQSTTLDCIQESMPTKPHKYMNATTLTTSSQDMDFNIAEKRRFRPIKEFLKYQKPKKYLNENKAESIPMKRNRSNIGKVMPKQDDCCSSIEVWQDNDEVTTLYSDTGHSSTIIEKVKIKPIARPSRHNLIRSNVTVRVDVNAQSGSNSALAEIKVDEAPETTSTSSSVHVHALTHLCDTINDMNVYVENKSRSSSVDKNRVLDLPDYQSQVTSAESKSSKSKLMNVYANHFDDTSVIMLNPKEADIYMLEGISKGANNVLDYDTSPCSSRSEMFVNSIDKNLEKKSFMGKLKSKFSK